MTGRRVLITGATSGLGREAALQLAQRGCRLAVTGRRLDRLQETASLIRERGGEALPLHGSVSDPLDVGSHYDEVRRAWGGLDWALLNAGVAVTQEGGTPQAQDYRRVFETNVFGVVHWMEAVLPDMIRAKSGTIAGVSSLAAYRGLPGSGAYCASKAALNTLLESARVELRGTGVRVVTVCPGFVRSEITDRNDPEEMAFFLETPAGVRLMLRGIEQGEAKVFFPWQMSLLVRYLLARLPDWLYDRVASRRSMKWRECRSRH